MEFFVLLACIVLFGGSQKPPNPARPFFMVVKIRPLICALSALSTSALLAQAPTAPAQPIPVAPAAPTPVHSGSVTPAPIEPPIEPPAGSAPIAPAPGGAPGVPSNIANAPEAPSGASGANVARSHEFQGDDIGLVIRSLARQAGISVVVSPKVVGTVNMRLENKTPREALEVIVDSNGLVMDEKNNVLYVKTQEERQREPAIANHYTFAYATAKDVQALLDKQLVSGLPSQVDVRTNTVFFRETKSNMDKIMLFLETVDRPTQQVMIEARLVEVTANPQQNYGINWAGVVGGSTPQTFRWGGTAPAGFTVNNGTPQLSTLPAATFQNGTVQPFDQLLGGIPGQGFLKSAAGQLAILSVPQMSITTALLNEDKDAQFLANPRVVTSNNQKAEIKITRNQPVPQLTFNEQSAQAIFNGFQDKEFGNTLVVTPVINRDNFISMSVKPEISNKVGDQTFTFQGATVTSPIIDKRTLDSNVLIKSGDTLAIGGLLQDEVNKSTTKVPVLGDIPVIGYAFQQHSNNRTKRNLLIFVTPTIINQGYGTGLEDQVSGLHHSGDEFADPNGWRNNAKGVVRWVPTSNRQVAADIPAPGIPPAPKKTSKKKPVYVDDTAGSTKQ